MSGGTHAASSRDTLNDTRASSAEGVGVDDGYHSLCRLLGWAGKRPWPALMLVPMIMARGRRFRGG